MSQGLFFMALVPVGVAMALGLSLLGGRLKPETRARMQRVMAAVFYPVVTLVWLWQAAGFADERNWIGAAAMLGLALYFGWMGLQAVRLGRLAPFAGRTP